MNLTASNSFWNLTLSCEIHAGRLDSKLYKFCVGPQTRLRQTSICLAEISTLDPKIPAERGQMNGVEYRHLGQDHAEALSQISVV